MRDPLQVLPMQIGMDLIHTVCAVSHAKTPDQVWMETCMRATVVYVCAVWLM